MMARSNLDLLIDKMNQCFMSRTGRTRQNRPRHQRGSQSTDELTSDNDSSPCAVQVRAPPHTHPGVGEIAGPSKTPSPWPNHLFPKHERVRLDQNQPNSK